MHCCAQLCVVDLLYNVNLFPTTCSNGKLALLALFVSSTMRIVIIVKYAYEYVPLGTRRLQYRTYAEYPLFQHSATASTVGQFSSIRESNHAAQAAKVRSRKGLGHEIGNHRFCRHVDRDNALLVI